MTKRRGPAWLYVGDPSPAQVRRRVTLAKGMGSICARPGCWASARHRRRWCLAHDVDEAAVERAMAGDRAVAAQLLPHELAEACVRLINSGLSRPAAAALLGISSRTVQRHTTGLGPLALSPRAA